MHMAACESSLVQENGNIKQNNHGHITSYQAQDLQSQSYQSQYL